MRPLFAWILDHKKTILVVFILAVIASLFLAQTVQVNFDFMDYLPDASPSTIALEVMDEEFSGGVPNMRVMVEQVTLPQALHIKELLLEMDGVQEATFLDDVENPEIPLEMMDPKVVETYYKDHCALFSLTVDSEKQIDVMHAIRDLLGEKGSLSGSAINTAVATETTGPEIQKIMLFVIPLCFGVLLLTTTSLFEPVLFMLTIGVAILLNNGTNAFMGEISFVTNAAGSILQLAVSMDYSIFLLHRFAECRLEQPNVRDAMLDALCKSVGSIFSSGVTTVIGFAALILMRFKIGPDMGIVMAKAIILSLLCVLVLLPVLTLYTYKLIDKTRHRQLVPSFRKLGKLVQKVRFPAIALFLILVVPCVIAQGRNTFYYGASQIFGLNTEVGQEQARVEEVFGKSNSLALLVPNGDLAKEKALADELSTIPEVKSLLSYVTNAGREIPTEFVPEDLRSQLISEHYSRMVLTVQTDYEGDKAFAVVDQLRSIAQKYYPDSFYLAGESANTEDLKNVVTADMNLVNWVAILAVFVVLIFTLKSATLPILLVLVIETSIWINLSVPYFTSSPLFYIGYLIISSIQLGATVDYAILLTSRFLEERKKWPKREALLRTTMTTSLSILTSAGILTLAGGFLGWISTHGIISQLGTLIARGAVLSTLLVLFVLPGLLSVLEPLIRKTTYRADFYTSNTKQKEGSNV